MALLVGVGAGAALIAGCGSAPRSPSSPPISRPDSSPASPAATRTASASPGGPEVTKVLVFVVENHSMRQMQQQMPWLDGVAHRYGYTTHYRALTHPSLPNYLAMAGGDMFGVADDHPPSAHPIHAPSVFGRALAAGRTATVYAESMTDPCQRADGGRYAVRHNPWTYFPAERRACRQHDVPLAALERDVGSGSLPNVGLVVPDTCSDADDCPLSRADEWMREHVGRVLDGADFASGHLAVVVTADEDDEEHGNRVLTVVAHPSLDRVVVDAELTHYSLSRAYAEAAGVEPLAQAARAPSLLGAFGLG